MKPLLFCCLLLWASQVGHAQTIMNCRLLPANATAASNLKLVYTVFWSGCGVAAGYLFTRSGTTLAVDACLSTPQLSAGCTRSDTLELGQLPAGTYSVVTTRHISSSLARCPTSPPFGFPHLTTITVGGALATRRAVAAWHLTPTVVRATPAELTLTGTPALQQVVIYDVTGREKARFEAATLRSQQNAVRLALPPLAPAVYLLRLLDQSGSTSTQRFVCQ